MVGTAVKLTACPVQIVVADGVIFTEGVVVGNTMIVKLFEVVIIGDAQAAFDVIAQETTSPLSKVFVLNIAEFVPAFTPFNFHW